MFILQFVIMEIYKKGLSPKTSPRPSPKESVRWNERCEYNLYCGCYLSFVSYLGVKLWGDNECVGKVYTLLLLSESRIKD